MTLSTEAVRFVAFITLALLSAACGQQKSLSREDAAKLITRGIKLPERVPFRFATEYFISIYEGKDAYDRAVAKLNKLQSASLGKTTLKGDQQARGTYARFELRPDVISEFGMGDGGASPPRGAIPQIVSSIKLAGMELTLAEVTGIAFTSDAKSDARADFVLKVAPTKICQLIDDCMREANSFPRKFVAVLKLYDDGWRMMDYDPAEKR